jgi:cytoskeleton protein RodZ
MSSSNRNHRSNRKNRSPGNGENGAPRPPRAGREPPTERLGDILRRRREQRGDDLQHIADYLCIRKGFLTALENSDYNELPADAYVIGFLRSYSAYLGFDGREAIEHYRLEMAGRRRKTMLVLPTPITEGRTPSTPIMIGAAIAALLIYAAWYGFSGSDRAIVSMPPPLPAPSTAAATAPATDASTAAAGSSPVIAPAPAVSVPQAPHLVIKAEKESWVLVADVKGNTVFDHVMKAGEAYEVPDTQGLKLTTGNGNAITISLDGSDLPKLSRDSGILHDIPLDPARLKPPATVQ